MTTSRYELITGACIAVAVASAIAFDAAGSLRWLSGVAGIAAGVIAAAAYFVPRLTPRGTDANLLKKLVLADEKMSSRRDKCKRCGLRRVLDSEKVCWDCRAIDMDEAENWLTEHPCFEHYTHPKKPNPSGARAGSD